MTQILYRMRPGQMAAFQAQARRGFEADVLDWLRAHQADSLEGLPAELLPGRVRMAISRARVHGYTWQSSIATFVALMFELGPNFDRHPAFEQALRAPIEDENARILAVFDQVTDEDWEDAQEFSDPSLWFRETLCDGGSGS